MVELWCSKVEVVPRHNTINIYCNLIWKENKGPKFKTALPGVSVYLFTYIATISFKLEWSCKILGWYPTLNGNISQLGLPNILCFIWRNLSRSNRQNYSNLSSDFHLNKRKTEWMFTLVTTCSQHPNNIFWIWPKRSNVTDHPKYVKWALLEISICLWHWEF